MTGVPGAGPRRTTWATLIITGPPAAGKTTIRRAIRPLFDALFDTYLDIGVDEVLRGMHRDGRLGTDGTIGQDGSLLLGGDWRRHVRLALVELIRTRQEYDGPALIEAPTEAAWVVPFVQDRVLAMSSAILYVKAPLEVRAERNLHRASGRISQANLLAMPSSLAPDNLAEVLQASRHVLFADATLDVVSTLAITEPFVRSYLDSLEAPLEQTAHRDRRARGLPGMQVGEV
ncbi:phosphotransferase-like protein [Micromonospora chokoriensis]|uniref:phosphotransferase-like protein n=1 Tax=Micromonospora chokoriensis TaxID=356851 RepID=UPI0004C3E706|nr:hypothetical protein [Micromonospora chokoriensis]